MSACAPSILVQSTYRTLMKHAARIDRDACARMLVISHSKQHYDHHLREWQPTPSDSSDTPEARKIIDYLVRSANGNRDLYLPHNPDTKSIRSVVRHTFKNSTATATNLSASFAGVKLTNQVLALAAKLPQQESTPTSTVSRSPPTLSLLQGLPAAPAPLAEDTPADQPADSASATTSGRGTVLLSHPLLPDFFKHSVILVTRRDEDHTIGIVVNKPLTSAEGGYLPVWAMVPSTFHPLFTTHLAQHPVMVGGPVSNPDGTDRHSLYLVHTVPNISKSMRISKDLYLSGDLDELELAVTSGAAKPADMMVLMGYAAWGANQLEGEIQSGGWIVASTEDSAKLAFSCSQPVAADSNEIVSDPESFWKMSIKALGKPFEGVTRMSTIHDIFESES